MFVRQLLAAALFAAPVLASNLVAAAEMQGTLSAVKKASGDTPATLVLADKNGRDQLGRKLSSNVSVTRDGKPAKLDELQKGDTLTVRTNDAGEVTEIVAQSGGSARTPASSAADVTDILSKLNLSAEQKDKIKAICQECDQDRESTWKQFGARYREAIGVEASLLAAVEDHLTDLQKKHVRKERRRIARQEARAGKSKAAKEQAGDNRSDAVEEFIILGVTLTPEQEASADAVHSNYGARLAALNRQIEELHARLVALETERLLRIEEVLTKEQRQQLRKEHQKLERAENL